jgi:predicted porin
MKERSSFAVKQGSLIALACAAAFAVPQAQAAEGFTVLRAEGHPLTLQGNISAGYARSKSTSPSADFPDHGTVWSGESNVRFSASTKLGGGFIEGLGFQVESGFETSDGSVSASQGTLASRNTGIGLKTSIGSLWVGKWDTPMKQSISTFQLTAAPQGFGGSTVGWYGTPGLGGGSFTGTQQTFSSTTGTLTNAPVLGAPCGNLTGTAGVNSVPATMNFRRRQGNTINYYTNNYSGFQFGAQYSPDEEGQCNAAGAKPTQWSVVAGYFNGPLVVAAAYERHENYLWGSAVGTKLGTVNAGLGTGSSDHAVNAGAHYTFGPVLLTAFWERLTYNQSGGTAALTDIEGQKYYLGGRWTIAGPHALALAFGKANGLSCEGTAAWQRASACNDTGAKFYLVHYRYQLDRVSYINLLYSKTDNDSNGNFRGTNNAGNAGNGHEDKGWSIGLNTSF